MWFVYGKGDMELSDLKEAMAVQDSIPMRILPG
jgi:hypothetical protein